MAAEPQIVVEGLDVDAEPGDLLVLVDHAEIAAHVFVAVALVAQDALHLLGHLANEIVPGRLAGDAEAQRHGIRHHPRYAAALRRDTGRNHGDERQVLAIGGAGIVRRDERNQHLRQTGPHGAGQGMQGGDPAAIEVGTVAQKTTGRRRLARCQRHRCRQALQPLGPEGLVLLEMAGRTIVRVGIKQRLQRSELARRDVAALDHGAVDVRHAARQHAAGIAIDQNVMGAVIPDPVVIGELQQRAHPETVVDEIQRRPQLVTHPHLGNLCRAICIAKVQNFEVCRVFGIDDLLWASVDLADLAAN